MLQRLNKGAKPRFAVVQYGARHNYSIPLALHRASALEFVYTDFSAARGVGRLAKTLVPKSSRLAGVLNRRVPPAEIRNSIHAFPVQFLTGSLLDGTRNRFGSRDDAYANRKNWLERSMLRRGFGRATHIYSMFGEGGSFVQRAKDHGLVTVGDVYVALSADPIVYEESIRFPDWCEGRLARARVEDQAERNQTLLKYSDILICPSNFVVKDLVDNHGADPERCLLAPYGVSPRWTSLVTEPEVGRVLFAGTASLRKGIHYLAMAATRLKRKCSIRVAGLASELVRTHPAARDLEFLGHLNLEQMAIEFARADVFVLPTLAEGAAGVTAEALGAGVPVVTTEAAGSIVRNGIDGFIVPERDVDALTNAILAIVEDRERRNAMGRAARQRALSVTWDDFAARVIAAASVRDGGA